jgi:Spy/CpxP family protein refolding chaperone
MHFKLIAIAVGSSLMLGKMNADAVSVIPEACQIQQQTTEALPGFPGIELSKDQKDQIKTIEARIRAQILSLLTPNQLGILVKSLEQDGIKNEDAFARLSLSSQQRKKLEEIYSSSQKQIMETLTSSQIEQLQQQASP